MQYGPFVGRECWAVKTDIFTQTHETRMNVSQEKRRNTKENLAAIPRKRTGKNKTKRQRMVKKEGGRNSNSAALSGSLDVIPNLVSRESSQTEERTQYNFGHFSGSSFAFIFMLFLPTFRYLVPFSRFCFVSVTLSTPSDVDEVRRAVAASLHGATEGE